MDNVQISEILTKDLLSGKSKYIKDGIITFNRVTFDPSSQGGPVVKFYLNEDLLSSIQYDTLWTPGSTLSLQLSKGTMEIAISLI